MALEARMIADARRAEKLHDALLQNLQGTLFRFQAARNLMTRSPAEAMRSMNEAIDEAEKTLDESRAAIEDLRSGPIAKAMQRKCR